MAKIIQRITLEGAEAIRAQLRAIGATGKDAFDKLGDVRRLNDSLSQADVHLNRLATSLKTFGANAQSAGQAGVAFGNAVGSSLTRLTVIAGPKVYSSRTRRFSSLCFGTIKTPQSSARSSENAVMNAREVARAARRCIDIAHERLRMGEALLVFAEGARSRTRGMQEMLPGASRYLAGPDTWVLPIGIIGTEALFPIGEDTLHTVRIVARAGPAMESRLLLERADGNRRLMMDVIGLAIAELLPPHYRGVYGDATNLDEARRLSHEIRRSGDLYKRSGDQE